MFMIISSFFEQPQLVIHIDFDPFILLAKTKNHYLEFVI
ncbi:hypothetical protein LLB_0695 [Legionella longbeachae D-4968]|nr:hypothetical protein LLB_0695 [Legionella longbeachae D-4968]